MDIQALWQLAIKDAFVGAAPAVELRIFDGNAPKGANQASLYPPDYFIKQNDPSFPLSKEDLLALNRDFRDRYRIGIFVDYEAPELLGRLRHELEHVRQFEAYGNGLFDFYDFLKEALVEVWESHAGFIYNTIPMEIDANAAASSLLSNTYGPEVIAQIEQSESGSALVRRRVGPQSLESLPDRMLAFGVIHRDGCDKAAVRHGAADFRHLCREEYSGLFEEDVLAALDH